MKKTKIYSLIDPISKEIKWVGATRQKYLCNRLVTHIQSAKGRGKPVGCSAWIKSLLDNGLRPIIQQIETTNDPINREIYWIEFYKKQGFNLLNISPGGYLLAKETIEKIVSVNKGKKRSKEFSLNLSKFFKNRPKTEEQKQKIANTLRGRKLPKEVCEKVSLALKGKKKPLRTKEHSLKLALSKIGKKQSKESNLKRSIALKGRVISEEHRKKLSLSAKKRYLKVE